MRNLKDAPLNTLCEIKECLSPNKEGVYRLLEMGLIKGSVFRVLRNSKLFGAIEIAVAESRLCIDKELAKEFLVSLSNK